MLIGCDGPHNADDYALDTVVNFGAQGDAERFRGEGWSHAEPAFTWALGPRARLHMNVRWNSRPLGLRMRLAGMHHLPDLPFQTVEVAANDIVVATWQVAKTGDFTAVIPPDVLAKRRVLYLELRLANATSPKALGLTADSRPLGVSCFEMQLTKAVAPQDMWPQLAAR
ncbi:MAG: hypothetical protein ABR589_00190 [Chthoniobacterales bacterium]